MPAAVARAASASTVGFAISSRGEIANPASRARRIKVIANMLSPPRVKKFASAFGDDPFSQAQIAFLRKHEIGITESPVMAGARPGIYAITLTGAERAHF